MTGWIPHAFESERRWQKGTMRDGIVTVPDWIPASGNEDLDLI
jgi:hypothetical protein